MVTAWVLMVTLVMTETPDHGRRTAIQMRLTVAMVFEFLGKVDKPKGSGKNILGGIGNIIGSIIPDPRTAVCLHRCQGNNISMFSNFKGGWLTKRWENLAPGKLVCLDSSSCNVFAGNKCNLYSFDPANGCRRSAGPVGQRNQDGCFDPDAKITMADGSTRAIKFIRAGDKVFNPMTKKSMTVETVIKGPEKKPLYLVEHNKGATLVTSKHPFVLKSGLVILKLISSRQVTSYKTSEASG